MASGTKSLALALGILGLESQVLVDIAVISVTCRKVPLSSQFFATPLREVVDLPATSSRLADHISPCQLAECTLHIGQYRHWTETDRQTSRQTDTNAIIISRFYLYFNNSLLNSAIV